ncbi:MAG: LacI family transcriptional regulator [Treponema sp.]|nr:LacI family transcriptional regulator [Treponema sp.]
MVTLKDIARECGFSFSTVSKALQGSPEISSETIKIVQEKAKEMGYHPNIAARTLRTNRTNDIGIIFVDKTGSGFQHQYFAKIISGLQTVTQEKGYDVTFIGPTHDKNYDYFRHINGRNFDGVAILSADFSRKDIQTLIHSEIPTVTLDYTYDSEHLSVFSDNKKGMTELTEYVISKGHKRIAMIHGENTSVTQDRKTVFLKVLADHGISIPETYFAQGLYHDPITSSEATNILLSLPEPPTCIFFPDDYSALGGIREINSRHLTLGKDISIVGYDGIMLTSMMLPPLTTYEQDGESIGKKMAELLIHKIEKKKLPEKTQVLISGRLLKGGTVADINGQ